MCEIDLDFRIVGKAIVFKGDDSTNSNCDPYVTELKKINLDSKLIPALKFTFHNLDDLKNKLHCPDKFSGVVLSSPRCVEALEKCGSLSSWLNHIFFTVGSKTANCVKKLGIEPVGEACGNAAALAEFILRDFSNLELPLLLPHGNLSLQTLKDHLTSGGIKVDPIEVYCTKPNPLLEESLREHFEEYVAVDYVIYMSPSAVSASLHLLKKFQDLSTIKFVTLGATTADSLEDNGITASGVAERPTPQHLTAVMAEIITSERKS